jgi:hypothetical protein
MSVPRSTFGNLEAIVDGSGAVPLTLAG